MPSHSIPPTKVTLKQIAEKAGVSPSAVSFAIHGTGRLSEGKRRHIREVAESLGYRPNQLVQSLRSGRTQTIGVMMLMRTKLFFPARLFRGIHDALLAENHVPLVLGPSPDKDERAIIHMLLDRRVDGLLMRPDGKAQWERHLDEILGRGIPLVVFDSDISQGRHNLDFVGTDDAMGGRLAADHLLELGHRRVAVITYDRHNAPTRLRAEAFKRRIKRTPQTTCQPIRSDSSEGYHAARTLLEQTLRPTAIFATNDLMAMSVYRAAKELRLKIPRDLSVIGFGDDPQAPLLAPALTTLHQDPVRMGQEAARLLLEKIRTGNSTGNSTGSPRKILLEPTLIERHSTAAPR